MQNNIRHCKHSKKVEQMNFVHYLHFVYIPIRRVLIHKIRQKSNNTYILRFFNLTKNNVIDRTNVFLYIQKNRFMFIGNYDISSRFVYSSIAREIRKKTFDRIV